MTENKAERVVEKFEDLESEICDLRNMADIVSGFIEDRVNGMHRRIMHGDQQLVTVTVREADLMTFSVYQIEKLAKELKEKFYAILEERK